MIKPRCKQCGSIIEAHYDTHDEATYCEKCMKERLIKHPRTYCISLGDYI